MYVDISPDQTLEVKAGHCVPYPSLSNAASQPLCVLSIVCVNLHWVQVDEVYHVFTLFNLS